MNWSPPDLSGAVALVTGASRGVGRGIAVALGEAGAKVYVTGRSRGARRTEGLPGTVDATAAEVTARGGVGVAMPADHTVDADTEAVFERIHRDDGILDILVNNAWAGYERASEARFDAPFWEQPLWRWDLFAGSLRAQYVASRLAVPLLRSRNSGENSGDDRGDSGMGRGLIVNISFTDGDVYLGQTAYDVSKMASDRMVVGMAHELRRTGVAAVAVHPGFVRTERVEAAWAHLGDGPAHIVHSPEYVGRGIAMLAADPDLHAVSGQRLAVGDLAAYYGFTDVDGRRLPAFTIEGRMTLAARMERLNRVAAAPARSAPTRSAPASAEPANTVQGSTA